MVLRIRYWLHEKKFLDVAKSLPQFVLYLRARLLILVPAGVSLPFSTLPRWKPKSQSGKRHWLLGAPRFQNLWRWWRITLKSCEILAIEGRLLKLLKQSFGQCNCAECSAFHGSTAVCFPWWWSTWWGRRADEPIRFVKWEFYKHYKSYQRKRPF